MRDRIPATEIKMSRPEVMHWKREIEASEKFMRREFAERINYKQLVAYFEGYQYPGDFYEDDLYKDYAMNSVAIKNEIAPAIFSIISSTYNQNPSISVSPAHPDADRYIAPLESYLQSPLSSNFRKFTLSDLMKAALNHAVKKVNLKLTNQMALFDMIVAGFACTEVNHRVEYIPKYGQKEKKQNIVDKVKNAFVRKEKPIKEGMDDEEVEQAVAHNTERAEENELFFSTYCKRLNPTQVLFDYTADTFDESRYVVKVIYKQLSEFYALYPDFKDKISSDSLVQGQFTDTHNDDSKKVVKLYQVEIKRPDRNRIAVFAKGLDEVIEYYENPILTNNFMIKYGSIDKYGKLYPMSRAKMMKKPQDELNHYQTIMMEHADREMHKIAYWAEGLTESGKSALHDNNIYGMVEKKTAGSVFEQVPQGGVTNENPALQQSQTDAIDKISQTNQLNKAGKSDSKYATQDAIKEKSFTVAISNYQDAIEDLVKDQLDALKDIIMQLWDGEDYFQITGLPGGSQWYRSEMGPLAELLIGDYMVDVDITTAQKPDPLKDRNEILELATFLTSPAGMTLVQASNRKISAGLLDSLIKSYNQSPEVVLEEIQQDPMNAQLMEGSINEPDIQALMPQLQG